MIAKIGSEDMKVKICGIRMEEIAKVAEENGADFLGFIFYPKSHRYIAPEKVKEIIKKRKKAKTVGVFVNENVEKVKDIATYCKLDYIQLHGTENDSYAMSLDFPVIKAYRWRDNFSYQEANSYPCEIVLLDSFQKGMAGGTGKRFAWHEAEKEIAKLEKPLLLAGGIDSKNVQEAYEILKPFGVDVSGSLETNGIKQREKIEEFMKVAKGDV